MPMTKQQRDEALSNLDHAAERFRSELARCAGLLAPAADNAGHHMATREFSVAMTHVDTAVLWAKHGICK